MSIIGQNKIQSLFNQSLYVIPHSIILCGENGSGRKSVCKEFADRFEMEYKFVDSKIDVDFVNDLMSSPSLTLVVFDGDKLIERDQNSLLKLIEEPSDNVYCGIITECVDFLLPTIKNRCQVWNMESYTKEQLQSFSQPSESQDLILELAHTPGQVQEYQQQPIQEIYQFAEKVIDNIDKAAIANTLMITERVAFKDEKDKYDYQLFGKLLLYVSKNRVLNSQDNKFIQGYNLTNQYLQTQRKYPRLDKRELFEHYLVTLWKGMREDGIKTT